jgi:hypothetical protein
LHSDDILGDSDCLFSERNYIVIERKCMKGAENA